MNVDELYRLACWYEEHVSSVGLRNAVEAVKSANNNLMTAPTNSNFNQQYNLKVEELVKLVADADLRPLDFDDINVLKKLKLEHIILEGAEPNQEDLKKNLIKQKLMKM